MENEYKDMSYLEIVFAVMDDNDLFNFHNPIAKELSKKASGLEEKIEEIIGTKVHPRLRNKLSSLFDDYKRAEIKSEDKERGLIYEAAFLDGASTMLKIILHM